MWMEVQIYSVKAKIQAGNIWVKDIITTYKRPKPQDIQLGIFKTFAFCQKIEQRALGPRKSTDGVI